MAGALSLPPPLRLLRFFLSLQTDVSRFQIKAGFEEGKELVLTVLKSMGEEQINAVKDGAWSGGRGS